MMRTVQSPVPTIAKIGLMKNCTIALENFDIVLIVMMSIVITVMIKIKGKILLVMILVIIILIMTLIMMKIMKSQNFFHI